jgi:dolichol-phosphate mannosyltransferase
MLSRVVEGADFVVGSRFVDHGTSDDSSSRLRWLASDVATLLAYPLTRISDPTSGFFMLRRSIVDSREDYDPIAHEIGLELLVRCECKRVVEVPIVDGGRYAKSKRSLREHLSSIQHIRRLYIHKFAFASQLLQFLLVGTSGCVVNLALLTAFLAFGLDEAVAPIPAIALSIAWNFSLNRRFSFSHARAGSISRQFLAYMSANSVGAVVNYLVTVLLVSRVGTPQLAASIGVVAGTAFNFTASRFFVFKATHVVARK